MSAHIIPRIQPRIGTTVSRAGLADRPEVVFTGLGEPTRRLEVLLDVAGFVPSHALSLRACPADFAVLILHDADNFYEHPRLKYLPDMDFGMKDSAFVDFFGIPAATLLAPASTANVLASVHRWLVRHNATVLAAILLKMGTYGFVRFLLPILPTATKELMPDAELWDVLPPHQNGANTLEQILKFKSKLGL